MNKKGLWIVGVIAVIGVVALLAAGGFTAAQLLGASTETNDPPAGSIVFEDVMDDGSGSPVTVTTIIEPSPLLPKEQPAASGAFLRQEDSSLFIGTGNINVSVNTVNGETSVATDHDGPEVEVVTGHDTQYFQDVTEIDEDMSESGERRYTQELLSAEAPDSFSEGSSITVWGSRSGDRVTADLIVFGSP